MNLTIGAQRTHRQGESALESIGCLFVLVLIGGAIWWFVSGKNPLGQNDEKRKMVLALHENYRTGHAAYVKHWNELAAAGKSSSKAQKLAAFQKCKEAILSISPFNPLGVDPGLAGAVSEFKTSALALIDFEVEELGRWTSDQPTRKALQQKMDAAMNKVDFELNRVAAEIGGIQRLPAPEQLPVQSLEERRAQSGENLKQICLAIHSYHDANKSLPSYGIQHPTTKVALLSWRVAILPYLDQSPLFSQIRQDEPWDSPHNKQFLGKMPKVYQLPGKSPDGRTHYQVFRSVGPTHSAFAEQYVKRTLVGITDGTSNTIFVVEASNPVDWMKPDDIAFQHSPLGFSVGSLGNHWYDDSFWAVFGDGVPRRLRRSIPPLELQAMITCTGGETVNVPRWEANP